jgi:tetratricopeptide (TPR) repeat protein
MAGPSRIDELRKKFDENPRRYFAPLANEYRKLGDFEQAIFICQEFLPQQPGHMSGHIVYGQALFEASRHDEARTVFETALSLDPENLIALRHLGDIARAHGDIETARAWYRRVLDSDPRNEEIAAILQALDSDPTGAVLAASGAAPQSPSAAPDTGSETPAATAPHIESLIAPNAGTAEAASGTGAPTSESSFSPLAGLTSAADSVTSPPVSFDQEADLDALFPTGAAAGGNEYQDAPPLEAPSGPIVEPSLLDTPSPSPAAGAFVTETMAELYLQQGHREEALGVYRQLVEMHPNDEAMRGKLQALERAPAEVAREHEPVAAVDEGPTIRDFLLALAQFRPRTTLSAAQTAGDAAVHADAPVVETRQPAPPPPEPPRTAAPQENRSGGTVGGSLDALFAGAQSMNADTARSPLEVAFSADPADLAERPRADDAGAALRGRPATPAATELSLDHVFRHATPSNATQQQGGFSFDQFFSRQAQDEAGGATPEPAREGEGGEGDDIQQFNAWLEGLKKT